MSENGGGTETVFSGPDSVSQYSYWASAEAEAAGSVAGDDVD